MTVAIQASRLDSRLLGAASFAVISSSRMAVSCRYSRKIVTLNRSAAHAVVSGSVDLGYAPTAMCIFSSALWSVTEDGYLLKVTTADTPILTSATNIHAEDYWITSYGSVLVAPGRAGGIVSLNSTPTVLHYLDGVLSRVTFAIASSSGYVYLFDGFGQGAVVTVHTTTGVFTTIGTFTATNCQSMLGGYITGTSLVVAVKGRASVITFDISTPGAPTVSTRTAYDTSGYTLNAVLDDTTGTPLTNEVYDSLGIRDWHRPSGGHYLSATEKAIAQGFTGRLVGFATLPVWATFDPADKTNTSTLSNNNLTAQVTTGYARFTPYNSDGKRQVDIRYVGGGTNAQVWVGFLSNAGTAPAASGFVYDGLGYFGHNGFDGGGHATLAINDILSVAWDADAGGLVYYKNGVVIAGNASWSTGDVLGTMTVAITGSTNVSQCSVDIITDPALFLYPVAGYTGFSS